MKRREEKDLPGSLLEGFGFALVVLKVRQDRTAHSWQCWRRRIVSSVAFQFAV
jgi:hypothetical protein